MTKTELTEQATAIERLRFMLPPGTTVYTILRNCSRSGMSRSISLIHEHASIDWLVARALGMKIDQKHDGIKISGCGMDMGFDLVYQLSYALYSDGFDCIGANCPSNDHFNGHNPTHHIDGGYALQQSWL